MKLKKKKLNKDKSQFKARGEALPKPLCLAFGNYGIYFVKTCRIELIYLVMLRKILKRAGRRPRRAKVVPYRRIWFNLRKNYVISKKSKNARMGKGKGKFVRYAAQVVANYLILEFFGWHPIVLKNIARAFYKKTALHVKVHTTENEVRRAVVNNTQYSYLFIKKYTLN